MDHAERDAFKAKLARNRVIPAVRDDFSLIKALNAPGEIVFVLYGDILTLDMKVEKILKHGKMPFIHLGMIFGFANNPIMLNYLFRYFQRECGVITTKSSMAKAALGMGIRVIQRYFILDSLSLDGATQVEADAIEVMPGILPGVNAYMSQRMSVPIIAGGLIQTVREVEESLASGATAISTSQTMLWNFKQS